MTSQGPGRPRITPDEQAMLKALQPDFNTIAGVLDDLEEMGVNVERERAQLDASELVRQGLLSKFPAKGRRTSDS
jgi:hypothetical protein